MSYSGGDSTEYSKGGENDRMTLDYSIKIGSSPSERPYQMMRKNSHITDHFNTEAL